MGFYKAWENCNISSTDDSSVQKKLAGNLEGGHIPSVIPLYALQTEICRRISKAKVAWSCRMVIFHKLPSSSQVAVWCTTMLYSSVWNKTLNMKVQQQLYWISVAFLLANNWWQEKINSVLYIMRLSVCLVQWNGNVQWKSTMERKYLVCKL